MGTELKRQTPAQETNENIKNMRKQGNKMYPKIARAPKANPPGTEDE